MLPGSDLSPWFSMNCDLGLRSSQGSSPPLEVHSGLDPYWDDMISYLQAFPRWTSTYQVTSRCLRVSPQGNDPLDSSQDQRLLLTLLDIGFEEVKDWVVHHGLLL